MPEVKVTVTHEAGLHARPASEFVKIAKTFSATVNVLFDGRKANAKSILSILTLGASQGSEIIIQADGDDAEAALQALESLIACRFGE